MHFDRVFRGGCVLFRWARFWRWGMCIGSALLGVGLLLVFVYLERVQNEFLARNFDVMHGGRALLRAEILANRVMGDLQLARFDSRGIVKAQGSLETALAYANDAYLRASQQEKEALKRGAALLEEMREVLAQGKADEARLLAWESRVRELARNFSDADGDRWGNWSNLNAQLRTEIGIGRWLSLMASLLLCVLAVWSAFDLRRQKDMAFELRHLRNRLDDDAGLRRRIELALHESERALFLERERIEAILATLDEAIVLTDAAGRIAHMNAAAEQLFACRAPDVQGREVSETLPAEMWGDDSPQVAVSRLLSHELSTLRRFFSLRIAGRGATLFALTASVLLDRECAVAGLILSICHAPQNLEALAPPGGRSSGA